MSSHSINQKKEIFYVKIKSAKQRNKPLIKRTIEHSFLKDFNKFNDVIKNAIMNLEKSINLGDYIIVLIINHPVLNDIYIYEKEQWQLYYNYNIIEQCINNEILKVKYELVAKKDSLKKIGSNKRKVFKYIMQNISISSFSKVFFKFLKENKEISIKFQLFFIQELINEKTEKENKKNKNDKKLVDIDLNLNINNIISNEETEESSDVQDNKKANDERLNLKLDKEYILHTIDFLKSLEERFKSFSEKLNNLNKIKEIIGEEKENDEIEIEKNLEHKTSLKMNLEKSISNLSLFDDDNYENDNKSNNVLFTQMNLPPNYFKQLLNDDNFFKEIDKGEYYMGIEQFKDGINRQLLINTKNF